MAQRSERAPTYLNNVCVIESSVDFIREGFERLGAPEFCRHENFNHARTAAPRGHVRREFAILIEKLTPTLLHPQ